MQQYFTHDNGGRPFRVELNETNVMIYKEETDELICNFEPESVFIGKSPHNKTTRYGGDDGPFFDGNSILLKMEGYKYIYIGEVIYSFSCCHEIAEYVSPVGGSDVPYPYAVDTEQNYYLMIENVVLTNVPEKYKNAPYDYYFEVYDMLPEDKQGIAKYQDIMEYYIDDEPYTLNYYSNPSEDYDRLIPGYGNNMYIVKTDGNKTLLSKKDYIKILEDFGETMGFKKLNIIDIIQEKLY